MAFYTQIEVTVVLMAKNGVKISKKLYLDMLIMISHKLVVSCPTIFTGVESGIHSSLISRRKFHEPPVGVNLLIRN